MMDEKKITFSYGIEGITPEDVKEKLGDKDPYEFIAETMTEYVREKLHKLLKNIEVNNT